MKISKFTFWIITAGALFFSSCGNEELAEEQQNLVVAPSFSGTIGQLADANPVPQTRSGVIEDNENYADGEKFYWHGGDKAKVLFFPDGDINSTPVELIYTATVAEGVKSNTCEFSTTGSLPVGNYTVYALYPADGWSKDGNQYKATSTSLFPQYDASSTHLKDYMFMKADVGDMTISGESNNSINFKFKHLSSVIRFHITSDDDVSSSTMYYLTFKEISDEKFFYTEARLNSLDGTDLIPVAGSRSSYLSAISGTALPFIKKGSTWEIDFYLPVFPTDRSTDYMKLQIESVLTVDEYLSVQQFFGTRYGLSFTNQLSFMPNGFEAGKSYYFNLKVEF